jgi:tRNA isopentenyl-2-thiomethyl-A-37 hydroxylase MiaE
MLADKGDSRGAMDHFTKYLQLAQKAADAPAIRQRMADLERGEARPK